MALNDLLSLSESKDFFQQEITVERLRAAMPVMRQYIAYWREYPDIFVDFLCGGENAMQGTLKLYYYQRVFLRVSMRYRQVYATFPRGYSKSFLAVLVLMIRCVLYPGIDLFVTTGGNEI